MELNPPRARRPRRAGRGWGGSPAGAGRGRGGPPAGAERGRRRKQDGAAMEREAAGGKRERELVGWSRMKTDENGWETP